MMLTLSLHRCGTGGRGFADALVRQCQRRYGVFRAGCAAAQVRCSLTGPLDPLRRHDRNIRWRLPGEVVFHGNSAVSTLQSDPPADLTLPSMQLWT